MDEFEACPADMLVMGNDPVNVFLVDVDLARNLASLGDNFEWKDGGLRSWARRGRGCGRGSGSGRIIWRRCNGGRIIWLFWLFLVGDFERLR